MVEKAMVWCGSKCTGATWERSRKVPPRFGVWARAVPGVETAAVAPTARAVPPSLRRSRRVREEVGWSMIALLESGLPVEPGRGHAPAPVVPEVRSEVLEGPVPHADVDAGRHVHVPLLLGEVPLDIEEDVPSLARVHGAALAHEQIGHHRVV